MEKITKERYREYLEKLLDQVTEATICSVDEGYKQIELINYAMKELYLLDNEKISISPAIISERSCK
ncbi:hypothetical protein [Ruminococcus sp.]|uniref:hypothetical protein n=1 Tax=Ruminococcus sp. TaxID=41978 RepID=UPI0025D86503|nr:hypothetical protein [Ruminococcus sp.]